MILSEFRSNVYVILEDYKRTADPSLIDLFLNQGQEKINQLTHILRIAQNLPFTNGVVNIKPRPDAIKVSGRVIRVEDTSGSNRYLYKTSLDEMDILEGQDWRTKTTGALKRWIAGIPNEPAAAGILATQDGYSTLLVWPFLASGNVIVYFEGTPTKLTGDDTISDIPEHFHYGLCFYAAWMILMRRGDPSKQALMDMCKEQWQEYVAQAKAEVEQFMPRTE